MFTRRAATWGAIGAMISTIAVAAPLKGESIDIGPAVGARAPAFAAVDSNGAPRSLASLYGRKGFWCSFARRAGAPTASAS